ncbi:hypothetical protein EOD42_22430 [Rhodovarius crocodyli]|uniref:Uncharacterized protein n=1 Tax=Rhodovarius crocodyli TaxID=1979269 RepID=A0A437M1G5_9PROT|nr:hypothetical protein [Rhodovarius crocodyli]RVT91415.1 hypothetical protein EOD42_22430 [Rhodovarius crocodyli]
MSQSTVFPVKVDGIGAFTFRRRTIGDEIKIQAAYDEMVGGLAEPSSYLDSLATAMATYTVLANTWPGGWAPAEVKEMDAVMDDRIKDLLRVHGAFCLREDVFRPEGQRRFKALGQGSVADAGSVVPPQVQPAAE